MAQAARSALFLGFLLLAYSPVVATTAGGTTVGGEINTDTSWDVVGSPYEVIEDVFVRSGATLTITPGVVVELNDGRSIFVDAACTLNAIGTPDSVITFTRASSGRWGTIGSAEGTMTFRHCLVEWGWFGTFVEQLDGMIGHFLGTTTIEDCVLQHGVNGVEFHSGTAIFRRNLVQFMNQQGFVSWEHCQSTIEDNRVEHCGDDAFDITKVNGAEIVFRNNIVLDIGDDAIDMDFWQFATISHFEGYDIFEKGVNVSQNSVSVVAENMIIVNAGTGYEVSRNSNLTIYNCVAYDCQRGFVAERIEPPWFGARLFAANSISWACDQPIFVDEVSEAFVFNCILDTPQVYPGPGNLNTDPRFLDPANNDFRLAYNSPAIDAGWSDGPPDHDIRYRAREDDPNTPNTGGPTFGMPTYWDIGAHEFDPSLIGIGDGGAPAIARFGLRAYPSPASGPMGIQFDLTRAGRVEVGVYDVAGRLVRALHSGPLPAGTHRLAWDGTGARPGSGVYFIRLQEGSEQAVEKVVRVR